MNYPKQLLNQHKTIEIKIEILDKYNKVHNNTLHTLHNKITHIFNIYDNYNLKRIHSYCKQNLNWVYHIKKTLHFYHSISLLAFESYFKGF